MSSNIFYVVDTKLFKRITRGASSKGGPLVKSSKGGPLVESSKGGPLVCVGTWLRGRFVWITKSLKDSCVIDCIENKYD